MTINTVYTVSFKKDNQSDGMPIRVWDLPLRLFHCLLLIAVSGLFITAQLSKYAWAGDKALQIHFYLGYVVLILLLFRIIWGFIGSRYARFKQFPINIKAVWQMLKGKPYFPLGHSPLGALSVYALLTALMIQVSTGLFSNDGLDNYAPLAVHISQNQSDLITRYHKINQKIIFGLIVLHTIAIAVYHFKYKKPLTRAIITGDTRVDSALKSNAVIDNAFLRWKAFIVLILCTVIVIIGLYGLSI